ncbi:hypothetical protein Hanom_Chr09g00807841 [Helianthus anomalus]
MSEIPSPAINNPPPIPLKPPIPPDLPPNASDSSKSPNFSPQLECAVQRVPPIQPPLEYAASIQEKAVAQDPDLRCNRSNSGTIDTLFKSPIECQVPSRLGEVLGSNQKCDDVESGMCAPSNPKSSPSKRGSRYLRKQGTKSGSGDPELDELRANMVAHDAKLQMEADKANGITRNTRSRSKKNTVQIAGFGAVRKQKKSVKFSPMLSDLRVKEFIQNSPQVISSNQQGMGHVGSPTGVVSDNITGSPDTAVAGQKEQSPEVTTGNSGPVSPITMPQRLGLHLIRGIMGIILLRPMLLPRILL